MKQLYLNLKIQQTLPKVNIQQGLQNQQQVKNKDYIFNFTLNNLKVTSTYFIINFCLVPNISNE